MDNAIPPNYRFYYHPPTALLLHEAGMLIGDQQVTANNVPTLYEQLQRGTPLWTIDLDRSQQEILYSQLLWHYTCICYWTNWMLDRTLAAVDEYRYLGGSYYNFPHHFRRYTVPSEMLHQTDPLRLMWDEFIVTKPDRSTPQVLALWNELADSLKTINFHLHCCNAAITDTQLGGSMSRRIAIGYGHASAAIDETIRTGDIFARASQLLDMLRWSLYLANRDFRSLTIAAMLDTIRKSEKTVRGSRKVEAKWASAIPDILSHIQGRPPSFMESRLSYHNDLLSGSVFG